MRISSAVPTEFEKLKFPKTLYKYRNADDDQHRTILTDQIVYFAPPKSFEDKFDCKIPTRYDLLTDDEIFDGYLQTLKEINPTWDPIYVRQQAVIWSNRGLLKDKKRLKAMAKRDFEELNKRYGVLSLTAEPSNLEMWIKYSMNFNGFCVGFDPRVMFEFLGGGGGRVEYYATLPIIKPTDTLEYKIMTQSFSKLKKWEFEREYRVHKLWPCSIDNESRKIKIPASAYTEIILGHNIEVKKQKEIIIQAKNINPFIKIRVTNILDNKISMKSYRII